MRYGFAIDTKRCIGCHTCSTACRIENNLPAGMWWNRALTEGGAEMDTPAGEFPDATMSYLTVACQHCENPACVKVCPVGATYKDPETGVVRQDYDKCIGCRMCMSACPYNGVRSFNWEEPSYVVDFAMGDADVPPHQKHVVEKCTMCWHRLAKGEEPMCVKTCLARARFWGDLDDPESEVAKLVRERSSKQLLADEGTKPSVYYLV
ncbi:4Fe-4S dicluster domain-containing protein [Adlercreutzia sp. JBNU-10]|uniref:4Fe-4S dicluster domain-containing protein n=2 Tax=Adlercreutzia faecimuris TaxID=2897341 RepID=A0ABS9WEL9_9ACTN|nr:4Fe-4S dicluster domain-containing protein [Adlercreutzia sp. JBNU-10]MCI2241308.1 4Fe-4S dicluster domain-containing protein [Adlercreutzia sp. JBNU-10]